MGPPSQEAKLDEVVPAQVAASREGLSALLLIPNLLTSYRILTAVLLFIFAFTLPPRWITLAVYFTGLVSDKLDGVLARRLGQESRLGNKLDPIADVLFAYALLFFLTRTTDFPRLILTVAMAMLAVIALYIVIRAIAGRMKFSKVPSLIEGKAMVVIFHAAVISFLFKLPFRHLLFWATLVGGVLTVFSYLARMYYNHSQV